ncbi:MAG: amidohydrolase [Betaproteobacteria bacterium]|nr:amidohydrolase [Betaproteobacteria bacterium]
MGKIALEEHFNAPVFSSKLPDLFSPDVLGPIEERLAEFNEQRLQAMDTGGIEITVLSQTSPGVSQLHDRQAAIEAAQACNDYLAKNIRLNPSRYRGFACVPLQDPQAAAIELERCVKEYGFLGGLVNGHTNGHYLDFPEFSVFWKMLEQLDVPLYLHPVAPYGLPHVFEGLPALDGALWSWTCETASHALRLVFAGVFERHPAAKLILGHMGETLPFHLWRLDSRAEILPLSRRPARPPSEVIREHFWITTSGVCSDGALLCSLQELGKDRVMFSVDYPYESSQIACSWIDAAPLDEPTHAKVCWQNAAELLKISTGSQC